MDLAEKLNEKLYIAFDSENSFKFHEVILGINQKVSVLVRATSNLIKVSGNIPFKW